MRPGRYAPADERSTEIIDAIQLERGADNWKDVCDWLHGEGREPEHDGRGNVSFLAGRRTGILRVTAKTGDWVTCNWHGQWGVITNDNFTARYPRLIEP